MATSLLLTAVLDVGLALAVFDLAKRWHAGDQIAYLASGVGPVSMLGISWLRARRLSGASIAVLVFLVLSSAAAFVGGSNARLLIVKDSLVTGGFGLACLASLLLPRPLMFYFGARFATDGTSEGLRQWDGLWRYPGFRSSQYLITAVWGVGFIVEASLRVLLASTIASFQTAFTVANVLPFVFFALLTIASIAIGKRAREGRGRSRGVIVADHDALRVPQDSPS